MRKILLFLIAATSFHFIFSQNILIISSGEAWSDPEHQEIYKYFSTGKRVFSWLDGDNAHWNKNDLSSYDIIWLHRADSIKSARFEDDNSFHKALLSYTEKGGKILLTQHALDFLNKSGLEPVAVEHRAKESQDNGYGRMLVKQYQKMGR